jgi:phage baseplate assembly protein gpV
MDQSYVRGVTLALLSRDQEVERMAGQPAAGVYRAIVTDNRDPQARGRLRVRVPEVESNEVWAELATLMAGNGYGTLFLPDKGDEVLVAFEAGDPDRPYVIGALWGSGERAPTGDVKAIRTRCGATITIDDARCEIHVDAPGGIRLTTSGRFQAQASQASVDAAQLTFNSGMATFSGVVKCDTLIANSVVASSYSPGAGNVM